MSKVAQRRSVMANGAVRVGLGTDKMVVKKCMFTLTKALLKWGQIAFEHS